MVEFKLPDGTRMSEEVFEALCRRRYEAVLRQRGIERRSFLHLVDHKGRYVEFPRVKEASPVRLLLERHGGENELTITVLLNRSWSSSLDEPEWFFEAVRQGIMAWAGDYEVFGGQQLRVRVKLQEKTSGLGGVRIVYLPQEISDSAAEIIEKLPLKGDYAKRIESMTRGRRSFAMNGSVLWKINLPKLVFIQHRGDKPDFDEMANVIKHEFGHVLGLGDLYEGKLDHLKGVNEGTYPELDCYRIGEKRYWSVMCDYHAPVRNNDIEMLLLAFMEDRFQRYQPDILGKRISEALGRGN